jgi:hypothetical protein
MTTPPIDAVLDSQFLGRAPRPGLPRRFLGPWVKHIGDQWCPPFEVQTLIADSLLFRRQFDAIGLLGTVAINQTCKIIRVDRVC